MTKWTKMAAATLVSLTVLAPGLASAEGMNMKNTVNYSQFPDVMMNGADLVPLRKIAESLGYQVTWDNDEESVTLTLNSMMNSNMQDGTMDSNTMSIMVDKSNKNMAYTVKIKIGNPDVWVGMSEKMLSYTPVLIKDRTYVTKDFIDQFIANQMMMK